MKPETHLTDQIPAYVLSVLDAAETAQVEAHLAACAACQQDLHAYQEVVGLLALTVPSESPSPALKKRLLQEIKPEQRETAVSPTPTPRPQTQPSWWQNWRSWFQKRPIWQPVLVLALIFLLISNAQLRQQLQETSHPAGFGAVTLNGIEQNDPATGLIIISGDGLHGTLIVQDLPVLPETETYQLWLIKEGKHANGGIFNVNEDGYRAIWLDSEDPLASYTDFDITLEPAGGSPYPTGEKILKN